MAFVNQNTKKHPFLLSLIIQHSLAELLKRVRTYRFSKKYIAIICLNHETRENRERAERTFDHCSRHNFYININK